MCLIWRVLRIKNVSCHAAKIANQSLLLFELSFQSLQILGKISTHIFLEHSQFVEIYDVQISAFQPTLATGMCCVISRLSHFQWGSHTSRATTTNRKIPSASKGIIIKDHLDQIFLRCE